MNEPVVISSEKLGIQPITLTDENLNEVAKQLATNTVIKIKNIEKRIKKSEKLASQAKDIDTNVGFFGRLTGKAQKLNHQKFDLIIGVNTQHNELFREFADIQQEAIKLVQCHYKIFNGAITYFSSVFKGELKDANGKIINLGKNGEEIVKAIIQQAEEYYVEQQKNEETREIVQGTTKQVAFLNRQMEEKNISDKKRDNEFQSFKQAKDNLDDEQDRKIKSNELAIQTLKQEKDKLDHEQDEKIKNNAMAIQTFKQEKDKLDNEQDERIQANTYAIQHLSERKDVTDKRQDELLAKLQLKTNIAITVAVIASLIAAVVLVLYFKK